MLEQLSRLVSDSFFPSQGGNPVHFVSSRQSSSSIQTMHPSFNQFSIIPWIIEKIWAFFSREGTNPPYLKEKTPNGYLYEKEGVEIRLSPTQVRLEGISFSDEKSKEKFQEVILQIIDREKIEGVTTNNLYLAWLLWKADFPTNSVVVFFPSNKQPLHGFILSILKESCKKKDTLNREKQEALLSIEKMMISSIINNSFTSKKEQDIIEGNFDLKKAVRHIVALNKQLESKIDINSLIFSEKKGSYLRNALEKLKDETFSDVKCNRYNEKFTIQLQDLFILIQGTDKEKQLKILTEGVVFQKPSS